MKTKNGLQINLLKKKEIECLESPHQIYSNELLLKQNSKLCSTKKPGKKSKLYSLLQQQNPTFIKLMAQFAPPAPKYLCQSKALHFLVFEFLMKSTPKKKNEKTYQKNEIMHTKDHLATTV